MGRGDRGSPALVWLLLAGACSGTISTPGEGPGDDVAQGPGDPSGSAGAGPGSPLDPLDPAAPGSCESAEPAIAEVPLRRLSRVEYLNTVEDLLYGLTLPAPPEIPEDSTEAGFENSARLLSAPPLLVERYELTASQAAEAALADPDTRARILPCTSWETQAEQDSCTDEFLASFGTRAFRRPLTADERQAYADFIATTATEIDYEAAIELAVSALMQAPQFSYRIELGTSDGTVTPHELASRLSYLLWQSMPDDDLLAAADADALSTPAQIEEQARRMLEDPRARRALIDFHRQWLDFDRVLDEPKNAEAFPEWSPALRDAIREEADRFVASVLVDGDGTLASLLTSRTSWVNPELADHYGLDPVDDWTEVELPADERSGILTRADFLAGQAHETNGSPVLRGVFVIDRLLCASLGAPPTDADTSTPEAEPGSGPVTNRMLFEERTRPPQCQTCHVQINGFGYGFENYDTTGSHRTLDATLPVDATGTIVGTDVDGDYEGAIELSERLADSETVSNCVAKNWLRYTVGRRTEQQDACLLERARTSLAETGGDVRELLVTIVTSPEFARGLP